MNPNSYNFVSPFYDDLAKVVYFNNVYKSQAAYLSDIPDKASILFIGGGAGKVLNCILKDKPLIQITYIEQSEKMLNRARRSCQYPNQVEFILGSENSIPTKGYDAIITFYFLDLFLPEVQEQIHNKLNNHLKTNGMWLVADFNSANSCWQKAIEFSMFIFLKWSTNIQAKRIYNIKKLFRKNSFKEESNTFFYGKYIFSTVFRKL